MEMEDNALLPGKEFYREKNRFSLYGNHGITQIEDIESVGNT